MKYNNVTAACAGFRFELDAQNPLKTPRHRPTSIDERKSMFKQRKYIQPPKISVWRILRRCSRNDVALLPV